MFAEATVPTTPGIELANQHQQPIGGRLDVGGELGNGLGQLIEVGSDGLMGRGLNRVLHAPPLQVSTVSPRVPRGLSRLRLAAELEISGSCSIEILMSEIAGA